MRRIIHSHVAPSMVIFVVHTLGIAVDEAERHAPIGLHGNGPLTFTVSFELVESKAGDIHISDGPGLVELGQNEAEPLGMSRLNPRGAPRRKNNSSPLCAKDLITAAIVTDKVTYSNRCRYNLRLCAT